MAKLIGLMMSSSTINLALADMMTAAGSRFNMKSITTKFLKEFTNFKRLSFFAEQLERIRN
jgi:hypothetical protein